MGANHSRKRAQTYPLNEIVFGREKLTKVAETNHNIIDFLAFGDGIFAYLLDNGSVIINSAGVENYLINGAVTCIYEYLGNLIAGYSGGQIILYNLRHLHKYREIGTCKYSVTALSFYGQNMFAGDMNGYIYHWQFSDADFTARSPNIAHVHRGQVTFIAAGLNCVYSAGLDEKVCIWRLISSGFYKAEDVAEPTFPQTICKDIGRILSFYLLNDILWFSTSGGIYTIHNGDVTCVHTARSILADPLQEEIFAKVAVFLDKTFHPIALIYSAGIILAINSAKFISREKSPGEWREIQFAANKIVVKEGIICNKIYLTNGKAIFENKIDF